MFEYENMSGSRPIHHDRARTQIKKTRLYGCTQLLSDLGGLAHEFVKLFWGMHLFVQSGARLAEAAIEARYRVAIVQHLPHHASAIDCYMKGVRTCIKLHDMMAKIWWGRRRRRCSCYLVEV